ncbi:hypothetical protein P8452_41767 [Trifolium repens]|nr:hypothetical protein P8452_41767 [Trifolium repens]
MIRRHENATRISQTANPSLSLMIILHLCCSRLRDYSKLDSAQATLKIEKVNGRDTGQASSRASFTFRKHNRKKIAIDK